MGSHPHGAARGERGRSTSTPGPRASKTADRHDDPQARHLSSWKGPEPHVRRSGADRPQLLHRPHGPPAEPMILTVTPNTALDRVLFLAGLRRNRRNQASRVVESMAG